MGRSPEPRNHLLRSLAPESLARLLPHLELQPLKARRVLRHSHLPIEHVHFIETGLVSVDVPTDPGKRTVETWMIGPEGFTGIPVALGVLASPFRRLVLIGGSAWVMRSADLMHAMECLPDLRRALLRYVHFVLVQNAQLGACNARHPLAGRLARSLLMASDRLESLDVPLTHETLAMMLGVRRASVTTFLHEFEQAGAIRVQRSRITVVDKAKLEDLACYCYQMLKCELLRSSCHSPIPT